MLIKRHSTVLALGTSGQFIESDFHSQNFEKIAAESQQKLIVSMVGYQTATEKKRLRMS